MEHDMETQLLNQSQIDRLNHISEHCIRDSYLVGMCRSIWITDRDDQFIE